MKPKIPFKERVAARSNLSLSKSERDFEDLLKHLGDELEIYQKSRTKTMALTMAVFKTGLWNKTHNTFAEFLMDRFGIQKSYAYLLIKAAKIAEGNPDEIIDNEHQARTLSNSQNKVHFNSHSNPQKPPENPAPSVRTGTDKKFHNCGIENSVKTGSGLGSKPLKIEKVVFFDKVGTPIPDDALPYWNRRQEVQDVLTQISRLRRDIKQARDSEDCLWVKHGQDAYEYLSRAYSYISDALPHAVCLQCQGSYSFQPDGCSVCGNTGLISEYRFEHYLPKELREIRMRSNQDFARTRPESPLNKNPEVENVC